MSNIFLSIIFLMILLTLLSIGIVEVPGVMVDGKLTNNFIFTGFFEILSFLATAAVIGPLASQFVKWRESREWEPARVNACKRLNAEFSKVIATTNNFFRWCEAGEFQHAKSEIDLARKNIAEFFESYDEEHPTFTAAMHSSGSLVRTELSSLFKQLNTTHRVVFGQSSYRAILHRHELDKVRALFDKPRLGKAGEPNPLTRDTFLDDKEPIAIEKDPYFFSENRLFFDFSIDGRFAAGTNYIDKFSGIDYQSLQKNWGMFLASCPSSKGVDNPINTEEVLSCDTQLELYNKWVKDLLDDYSDLSMLLGESEAREAIQDQ